LTGLLTIKVQHVRICCWLWHITRKTLRVLWRWNTFHVSQGWNTFHVSQVC